MEAFLVLLLICHASSLGALWTNAVISAQYLTAFSYTYGELSPEYICSVQKAPETHAALIHLL